VEVNAKVKKTKPDVDLIAEVKTRKLVVDHIVEARKKRKPDAVLIAEVKKRKLVVDHIVEVRK